MAQPNDHLPDLVRVSRDVQLISTVGEWITALDVTLNVVAAYNSHAFDVTSTSAAWVLIAIDSTGAPTNMRVLAQFSHDDGVTWWDFEEGLWASLYWEDADTATQIHKTFLLPCGGQDLLRFRTTGTGTTADATFAVEVHFRPFRGTYATAHA